MITKVIDNFNDNYAQLFANATKALKAKGEEQVYKQEDFKITTLEEYFMHLPVLYALSEEYILEGDVNVQRGETYGILPLQEPIFMINANTRTINVPDSMKSVGVAGDYNAEILYFAIDRYFDHNDLAAEDMETVIEWSNPNITNGVKKGSQPALLTLTNIPSYLNSETNNLFGSKLLIGWALGGDVMSAAGTVEFAIRFYHLDSTTGEVDFSFSTQPAKIIVNKTLQLELEPTSEIEDVVNNSVRNRIRNMVSTGIGGLLSAPVFWIDLNVKGKEDDNSIVTDHDSYDNIYYLDIPDGQNEYTARVAAKSGTHKCIYKWQYHGIDNTAGYEDCESKDYGDEYVLVDFAGWQDNKYEGLILYTANGSTYTEVDSQPSDEDVANEKIFYRVSKCRITKPGYYKANATIRTSSSTARSESCTLVIPGPSIPVIEAELQDAQVANENYISVILNGGNASMKVKVQDNSQDVSNITSYAWVKDNTDKSYESNICPDGNYKTIANKTDEPEMCVVNTEGWYKVTATNIRNKSVASTDSNPIYYRVTAPAKEMKIIRNLEGKQSANQRPTFDISCEGVPFDTISVQWYDFSTDEPHALLGNIQTYSEFGPNNMLTVTYAGPPLTGGQMPYAKITTHYNNSEKSITTGYIYMTNN